MFLVNRSDDLTGENADTFSARISAERLADPSMAWLQNTPNAKCFTTGTLVDFDNRPEIPRQRAETVFVDPMSLLIPTVYQAVFEEDFVQQTLAELKGDEFNAHFIESPLAINKAHNNTDDTVDSVASAYVCFIDFTDKNIVRPEIGDMVRVHIIQEEPTPDITGYAPVPESNNTAPKSGDTASKDTASKSSDTAPDSGDVAPKSEDTASKFGDAAPRSEEDAEIETGEAKSENSDTVSESGGDSELGSEDNVDVFDQDELDDDDPNHWLGRVVDPQDVTPSGNLTVIV